jgi:hypothetical protein
VSSGVSLILALAGSAYAISSLAAGEALRKDQRPFRKRVTSRMLLALALLGCAVVGKLLAGHQASEGAASGSGLSLLLLAAGTAATLWAFVGGPPYRGGESLGERITPRGSLAFGLLTAAQFVDLYNGPIPAAIKQFQSSANGSTSILALLGLVLVPLGTAAAAATFHSRKPLLANAGPLLRRLSPLTKGTLALLGLALGVVGLACFLSSDEVMLLCFVLLALGAMTCFFALYFAAKHGANDAPGPWGISSRGWVSLAFLALAGGLLGAREARLLGPLDSLTVAANKSGASPREAAAPAGDEPSVWSMKKYQPASPASTDPGSERTRLERELFEARRRLTALESGVRPDRSTEKAAPAAADRSVVDVSQWNHKLEVTGLQPGGGAGTDPGRSERDRLAKELADAQRKIADLEAGKGSARPPVNNAPAPSLSTVDVSKWRHAAP